MSKSAFIDYYHESYPHKFAGRLHIPALVGGIPSDPKVAEAWLQQKLGKNKDDLHRELVAKIMYERGISETQAAKEAEELRHLNGFKRLPETGQVYIEGRQLKAGIKEAVSVAVAADKLKKTGWGTTNKWLTKFVPEHIFVVEDQLPVFVNGEPVTSDSPRTADGKPVLQVQQRFVHTAMVHSIQYEEYVLNAEVDFTIITDFDFTERDWAMLWTTGEQQGVGATRSQGYGRYEVVKWERLEGEKPSD